MIFELSVVVNILLLMLGWVIGQSLAMARTKKTKTTDMLVISPEAVSEPISEDSPHKYALQLATQLNTKFVRALSHDLREPIRAQVNFAEILETRWSKLSDEKKLEFAGRIRAGAIRAEEMVSELRAFALEGCGGSPVGYTQVGTLLDRVLKRIDHKKEELDAKINVHVQTLGVQSLRVKTSVAVLIQNLLENALKYHGDKPPVIDIILRTENDMVCFIVKDQGVGFDPKHSERIFEMFKQLDPGVEGHGAGLAICREIVAQQGGTIKGTSEGVGRGAEFEACLPPES